MGVPPLWCATVGTIAVTAYRLNSSTVSTVFSGEGAEKEAEMGVYFGSWVCVCGGG